MDSIPGELASALAKAQAEMSNPGFDSQNPHFRSKFASLAAVRNAVVPALAKHGVFVTQELTRTENGVACSVILMHSSGQFRYAPFEMPLAKDDAQGVASASTYARRYTLQAIACVVGDDDDDGNAATGKNGKQHEESEVSQTQARLAASNLLAAHKKGYPGPVYDAHLELIQDEDLYRAAWALISAPVRREIKEMVDHEKHARMIEGSQREPAETA